MSVVLVVGEVCSAGKRVRVGRGINDEFGADQELVFVGADGLPGLFRGGSLGCL
jgi:hypothetical protein